MLIGGLGAAYLSLRNANSGEFVPEEMTFNNYTGSVLAATVALGSMGAEWAMTAVRNRQRRYAVMGWALAIAMGVAALNGVWFLGRDLQLGLADSPYATIVYAMFAAAGVAIAFGVAAAVLGLARTAGGHVSAERPELGRASAWAVHFATFAWVITYATVYLYK
jgi:heme/copper-type cytochrome/quinol oxidase subunit 3